MDTEELKNKKARLDDLKLTAAIPPALQIPTTAPVTPTSSLTNKPCPHTLKATTANPPAALTRRQPPC